MDMRAAALHFMMATIPLHGLILKHIVHYYGILERDQAVYSAVEEALATAATQDHVDQLPAAALTSAALGCELHMKCSRRNLERAAQHASQETL